ncbi:MAG: acetate/propionate family kinase [Coriobacteriales bacterium]
MKILVFNAGSSSLKYKLFDCDTTVVDEKGNPDPQLDTLSSGNVENIGLENPHFINRNVLGETFQAVDVADLDEAFDLVIKALVDIPGAPLDDLSEVDAIGHRVAHAGDKFSCSMKVDEHVIDVIRQYSDLAPLHNPFAIHSIQRTKELFPKAMQVAAFDTAFHQTMPRRSYIYPIPYRYYEKYGIRKYGFHGISHKYVSRRAAEFLHKDLRTLKMITCHIGAGASLCAIDHGYSMDTSMGYTPLDGVMMNTRSGSVDPAIITAIMEKENLTPHQMDEILNKESGFLGVSGTSSDLRDLKEVIRYGDTQAELAYDIFLFSIRRTIGSYAFELAGIDAIVLTAGVGEHDSYARRLIFRGLEPFGIEIDEARNHSSSNKERIISTDRSSVKVLVIPTDEEAEIANDTALIALGVDISDPWAY